MGQFSMELSCATGSVLGGNQHALHVFRGMYRWVPVQQWNQKWTDAALYQKYGITDDEIAFIAQMIRPMGAGDE